MAFLAQICGLLFILFFYVLGVIVFFTILKKQYLAHFY